MSGLSARAKRAQRRAQKREQQEAVQQFVEQVGDLSGPTQAEELNSKLIEITKKIASLKTRLKTRKGKGNTAAITEELGQLEILEKDAKDKLADIAAGAVSDDVEGGSNDNGGAPVGVEIEEQSDEEEEVPPYGWMEAPERGKPGLYTWRRVHPLKRQLNAKPIRLRIRDTADGRIMDVAGNGNFYSIIDSGWENGGVDIKRFLGLFELIGFGTMFYLVESRQKYTKGTRKDLTRRLAGRGTDDARNDLLADPARGHRSRLAFPQLGSMQVARALQEAVGDAMVHVGDTELFDNDAFCEFVRVAGDEDELPYGCLSTDTFSDTTSGQIHSTTYTTCRCKLKPQKEDEPRTVVFVIAWWIYYGKDFYGLADPEQYEAIKFFFDPVTGNNSDPIVTIDPEDNWLVVICPDTQSLGGTLNLPATADVRYYCYKQQLE